MKSWNVIVVSLVEFIVMGTSAEPPEKMEEEREAAEKSKKNRIDPAE